MAAVGARSACLQMLARLRGDIFYRAVPGDYDDRDKSPTIFHAQRETFIESVIPALCARGIDPAPESGKRHASCVDTPRCSGRPDCARLVGYVVDLAVWRNYRNMSIDPDSICKVGLPRRSL